MLFAVPTRSSAAPAQIATVSNYCRRKAPFSSYSPNPTTHTTPTHSTSSAMNEIFFRPITGRDRWVCIIRILHSNDYGHPLLGTNSDRSSRLVHCPTVPETKAIARAHTSSAMMERGDLERRRILYVC